MGTARCQLVRRTQQGTKKQNPIIIDNLMRTILTQRGNKTDTESSKEAAGNEQVLLSRSRLEDDTEIEHETGRNDEAKPTTHQISEWSSSEGAKESTSRENG